MKLTTCIDSSGIAFKPDNKAFIEKLDKLMDLTDLVMLDIKHIDPEKHKVPFSMISFFSMTLFLSIAGTPASL